MNIRIFASLYAMVIAAIILVVWIALYVSKGISELYAIPIETGVHISADIITAVILITGGMGLIRKSGWGFKVYLLSMGMLLYTLIMSAGYFSQQGVCLIVALFAGFIALTALLIVLSLFKEDFFK
jgi:hypothetical protein